ncbi:hypothetical protein [Seonamhaeicola maritimus]|uniref:hypothetical protein n=1 Tax=Seonamhaeicola maritimus TaxID=2591822 RepID=UPI0024946B04|nr:hypothetical protein [Seonamhaeicola maritimus]
MDDKIVLLLTGAVNAKGVSYLKRNNEEERLKDYKTSLKKWIKQNRIKIVFVENSKYPKEKIINHIGEIKNLEYLSFDGNKLAVSKGKGYAEISSIEYALEHSNFLKKADYIIKCSGRLFVNNAFRLLDFSDITKTDVIGNFNSSLDFFDSRLFVFTPFFFKTYFIKYKDRINDFESFYFEHALAAATHELLSNNKKWQPLPFPLIIQGISGTANLKYNNPFKNLFIYGKFYLKKIISG